MLRCANLARRCVIQRWHVLTSWWSRLCTSCRCFCCACPPCGACACLCALQWNYIDFVVVVFGFIALLPGVGKISAFRVVRVLRPLKTLNKMKGLRIIVLTLLGSLSKLGQAALLILFLFTVYSIICVQVCPGGRVVQLTSNLVNHFAMCDRGGGAARGAHARAWQVGSGEGHFWPLCTWRSCRCRRLSPPPRAEQQSLYAPCISIMCM